MGGLGKKLGGKKRSLKMGVRAPLQVIREDELYDKF